MIYRPEFFRLEELVPKEVFEERGQAGWELLDARALLTLDALRKELGGLVVNNWHQGGPYNESGFRTAETMTGAKFSQHRYGRAFDCKFVITPKEAEQYILANADKFPYLTTIENTDATKIWLHFDCRNNAQAGIRIVNP